MIVKSAFLSLCISSAFAFSSYESLTGIGQDIIEQFILQNPVAAIPKPPGPLEDDSLKLVNDEEHPFIPPGSDDIRGPCPGLNTLANHGVRCLESSSHTDHLSLTCFFFLCSTSLGRVLPLRLKL